MEWLQEGNGKGKAAGKCPYAVDLMDNAAMNAYRGFPERLYVVEDGKIKHVSVAGPWGYSVDEVRDWLKKRFA